MRPIQDIQVVNYCRPYIVPLSSNLQVLRQRSMVISGKESVGQCGRQHSVRKQSLVLLEIQIALAVIWVPMGKALTHKKTLKQTVEGST